MDKKGFIRTLEAIIAIIIVFVFIYVISQSSVESATRTSDSIKSLQEEILRGISENENLRNEVINFEVTLLGINLKGSDYPIIDYVEDNLPIKFKQNYALVICESNCGIPSTLPDKNVYTTAVIITSSIPGGYSPKIVRLWVW